MTTLSSPKTYEPVESTFCSSTVSKNDIVFESELPHLNYYEVIWFNSDVENPIKLNRLRKISDYIKLFDNFDNCRDYIEMVTTTSDKIAIFLVTSGHSSEKLILTVHNLNRIFSIHCLIKNSTEEEWMLKESKVSFYYHQKNTIMSNIVEKLSLREKYSKIETSKIENDLYLSI